MVSVDSLLNGVGGTVHGSFFQVNDSIDTEKPPGATSLDIQSGQQTPLDTLWGILNGAYFFYSPNLTWLGLAAVLWQPVPYNVVQPNVDWKEDLLVRLVANHAIVLGYVAFWHVVLDIFGWGKRSFVPNRPYIWARVAHNVFYTWLGILQWTFTEAAFLYCYRHGKLEVHPTLESAVDVAKLLLWVVAVPVIRDTHFYFAHRLIHMQFLYRFIHALHHRNSDIEPFSGICMHPCEHLYYYSCYAPLLFLPHHPFILFWMGMHTVLSPAASHSGYEDHFGCDLYHYLHHRYFECNYAGGIPFDRYFGTFRDRLKETDVVPKDTKATLWGFPEHPLYQILAVGLPIALLVCNSHVVPRYLSPNMLALVITVLPIVSAALLYRGSKPFAPFEKDSIPSLVLHVGSGILWGVVPVYFLLSLVLSN